MPENALFKKTWAVLAICFLSLLLSACASLLEKAPTQPEIALDALLETTTIAGEWATPAGDKGKVNDGWLASFNDPQLKALVIEALDTQNPRMRVMSSFVDRAEAMARLGGATLTPTVALGANLSETFGNDIVSGSHRELALQFLGKRTTGVESELGPTQQKNNIVRP